MFIRLALPPQNIVCSQVLALRLSHRLGDSPSQTLVSGQSEHVVHVLLLTPGHDLLATEAGVRPDDDVDIRPRLPDPRHDARKFLDGSSSSIDVGRTESGAQQVLAAEDVERQVTIVAVVAVEETRLLIAVQPIVSGVQVQDDLVWRLVVGLQEDIEEHLVYRLLLQHDLLVAFRW